MEQQSSAGHWPEMERLVEGLGKATMQTGGCYGICGPIGVGKTYLVRKLEKTAGELGFGVLRSSCEPGASSKDVFSMLLMHSSQDVYDQEHPLFLLGLLEELSSAGPVLLTIEDLHLAVPSVIPVLILMARNLPSLPVMIAFTYDCDMVDLAHGDVHPLIDGLRILSREGAYTEIRLHALDRVSLIGIVENEIMGQMDPSLSDFIWERSEGNLMVAMEEIRLLIQSKVAHKIGGIWGTSRPLALDLPDDYKAILENRLRTLTADDIELLTLAAVAGRSFDPWIISKVQNRRLLDVLEQLDRLSHDHHLVEEDREHYRFILGGIRSILLEDIPEDDRRELHNRVAEALERTSSDPSFNELSEHYYQAGSKEKCVCFSLLAGERFMSSANWEAAVQEFQKVLDATDDGGHHEERNHAQDRIAELKILIGH